jgi:Transposase DDE domain
LGGRLLRSWKPIALRVGKVIDRFKMGKHFVIEVTETSFSFRRDLDRIAAEAALDGIYVIRTNVPVSELAAEDAVRSYKRLSVVERAFRSCKTVDLHIRPIYHQLPERVRAHVFLCMLAYYVEWHLRQKLAPMLFEDEEPVAGEALRSSVVAPAQRSPRAQRKVSSLRTDDGLPTHSFATLPLVGAPGANRGASLAAMSHFEALFRLTIGDERSGNL